MNNTTITILVVAVIVVLLVVFMSSQKQAATPPPVVQQTQPANFWSSIGAIGSIIDSLNLGGGNTPPPTDPIPSVRLMMDNGEDSPYRTTQEAAQTGLSALQEMVENEGMQFNTL